MKDISWRWVLAFCLIMFVGGIAVRGALGDQYEVRINDILVLVLPFLLWLFATGQISSFELGGEKLTVKAVFAEAGSRPIYGQVNKIPVQPVSSADKGSLNEIPALRKKKIEALSLHLNTNIYYDSYVFSEYIRQLGTLSTFKWITISDTSGKFLGAIDILGGGKALLEPGAVERLVEILNMIQPASNLTDFPGFVPAIDSLSSDTDKQTALDRMEKTGMSWLPVVNIDRQFIGVVDRGRLTTSLILDVSRALQASASAK